MMVMAWLKVRRHVGWQLLHHDGMSRSHVGDVVVVIGSGVGIRFRRRGVAVGRGGGRSASLTGHVELQAPPGIVGGVAGSKDAAFQAHAALKMKAEVTDGPGGTAEGRGKTFRVGTVGIDS